MEFIVIAGMLIIFVVLSSKFTKKKQDAHAKTMAEQMVLGAWVQTIGGFCGKVVEIDGDVVVLETPSGEESLWLRRAIARVEEPPFAIEDEEDTEIVEEETVEEVSEKVEETITESLPEETVEEVKEIQEEK